MLGPLPSPCWREHAFRAGKGGRGRMSQCPSTLRPHDRSGGSSRELARRLPFVVIRRLSEKLTSPVGVVGADLNLITEDTPVSYRYAP